MTNAVVKHDPQMTGKVFDRKSKTDSTGWHYNQKTIIAKLVYSVLKQVLKQDCVCVGGGGGAK